MLRTSAGGGGEAIVAAEREFDAGLIYSPCAGERPKPLVEQAKKLPELGAARVLLHDPSGALVPPDTARARPTDRAGAPGRSEFGQLLRLLDEVLRLSTLAGAVDQARVELALGRNDRFAGFTRFETSFSGSSSRKTSIPLSAALATNRRAKSPPTGREPTRNLPRSAIPSGVLVRALSARIRSHGFSTPRAPLCRRRRRRKPRGTRSRRRRAARRAGGDPRSASALPAAPG